ncbi:MAG: MHYT domain-containing protein [Alphaproteobacteria bacterium]|nr:MHYT domain-containing protein [Alphaproteobacteria bacterium]
MLDGYFLSGPMPSNAETGSYNLWLVILSYIVASLGAYTGLAFATHMISAKAARTKNLMHAGGAFALGSGIWSMHFIGMLAYKMKMTVTYDPWLTLLSMVIAIAIAYGVLAIASSARLTAAKVIAGSILLGFGICAMHYTGMAAMQMGATLSYKPGLYALSVIIAVTASGAALGIIFFLGRHKGRFRYLWQTLAALVMGAAICGMHYTGMAAAIFTPLANCRYDPNQDFSTLALAIAAVTSAIFGIALFLGLYTRENDSLSDSETHIFPTRLLALTALLTLLATLWAGSSGLYVNYVLKNDIRHNIELNKLSTQIDYFSGMAVTAARMLALTGDSKWKTSQEDNARLWDTAIQNLQARNLAPALQGEMAELAASYHNLQQFNRKSLDLFSTGKRVAAHDLLETPDYVTSREASIKSNMVFIEHANILFSESMSAFARNVSYGMYLSLVMLTILPITWFFTFRAIRHWRKELENARGELAAREMELHRYIGEIEISQEEATKARVAAERANAAKSDFLANMSHEIRTPMNGLLGMARLLLGTEMTSEQRSWAEIIYGSGETLMSIINDILDFSKIEAGRLRLESITFDLHTVLAEVTDMLILRAEEKNIDLLVRITPGTPRFLMGDGGRFKQVVLNLVSNAIKFTAQGYVLIDVSGAPEGDYDSRLHVRVADTGIGISSEKLDYIFEKFSQAEESTTRRFGGTGLGLAISRRLIAMMGGEIKVASVVGQGSVFSFDIALPRATYKPVTRVPTCNLTGLRILVLCDSELERGSIGEYLAAWGMRGDFAPSLSEVFFLLQKAVSANDPYYFVYIDHKASAEKILDLAGKTHVVPGLEDTMFLVTAIFGSAMATRVFNSRDIAAFLTKPLFPEQLQDACKILWDAQQNKLTPGLVTRTMIARLQ